MTQQDPSRSNRRFEFYEEPLIVEYRKEPGTYELKQKDSLQFISWTGSELYFVELGDEESSAWGNDYMEIAGDFTIAYEIPKIVQGNYTVYLRAEAFNSSNALVEVFVDGKKVSGLVDLSSGGTAGSPFQTIELGTIDFVQYEKHLVEIKPLIPGRFLWDWIRFEPA